MAQGDFTIDIDAAGLLSALTRLGPAAEQHVKRAAEVTAKRVQQEVRTRVRRDTGKTAEMITVDEAPQPLGGYRVFVAQWVGASFVRPRPENLPIWLEFGTKHMSAQPFLFNSARLEEGAHERRIAAAIQDAINEQGLGS